MAPVNREAWATLIAELVQQEARGNKSAFARRIGGSTTVRTVDRWLRKEVNVSAEKVRQVAQALQLSEVDLLTRVGYISAQEAPVLGAAEFVAREREIVQLVESQQDIRPSRRRELIEMLTEEARQQHEALLRLAERMIEMERRAGGVA